MKILLVEDTRSVAAVIEARLTLFGHEVSIAENGQVAINKFPELSPDLVLMDIEMPLMNGFEATNRIRALFRNADTALYRAKKNGRNRVEFSD